MKKILIVMFVLIVASCMYAVDMKGKFGMGVGVSRSEDLLKPSLFAMRFGVSEKLQIEPRLDVSNKAIKLTIPEDIAGEDVTAELSYKNMALGLEGLYTLRGREKTNLYGILGFHYGMPKLTGKIIMGDDEAEVSIPISYIVVPLGIGGEHFLVEDVFSININTRFGFYKISGDLKAKVNGTETTLGNLSYSDLSIGNTMFNLYFMWYF